MPFRRHGGPLERRHLFEGLPPVEPAALGSSCVHAAPANAFDRSEGRLTGLELLAAAAGAALSVYGVFAAMRHRGDGWLGGPEGYRAAALALVGLFAVLALGGLDGLLARMHAVGIPDRGIGQLVGVSFGTTKDFAQETIQRWLNWYQSASTVAGGDLKAVVGYVPAPSVVLWTWLLIDSVVLVPAYVSLLAMIRWRTRWLTFEGEPPKEPFADLGDAIRRLAVPIAIGLADECENVLADLFVRRPLAGAEALVRAGLVRAGEVPKVAVNGAGIAAMRVATIAKVALVVYFILTTIPHLLALWVATRPARQGLGRALFRLRAFIGIDVAFAAVALLPLQVPDLYRRWGVAQAGLAVLSAIALGVMIWIWARRIVSARREPGRQPTWRRLVVVGGALVVVSATGLWSGPAGLVVPGAAILLVALLEVLMRMRSAEPEAPAVLRVGTTALPKLLAVTPGVLLGMGALKATFAETIRNHPNDARPALLVLLLAGALPIAGTMLFYLTLGLRRVAAIDLRPRVLLWARILAIVAAIYVYERELTAAWSFTQAVGALALAAIFLTMLASLFGALSLWVERVAPPRGLATLGFTRTPVFAFLLVWLIALGPVMTHLPFEQQRSYHDVRTDLVAARDAGAITLAQALSEWSSRNPSASATATRARTPIPMLFVAANGGGIKAATWAAFSLDCVLRGGDAIQSSATQGLCTKITPLGEDRTGSVFAMSGVSGGALGLTEFVAHELENGAPEDPGWVRSVLGDDFVSPSIAWQIYVEVPRALLQFEMGMDRAEVLERSWERGWSDTSLSHRILAALWGSDGPEPSPLQRGLLTTWAQHGDQIPLLLLNSATVEDGCRFIVSPLETDGIDDPKATSSTGQGGRNCTSISRLSDPLPTDQLFGATRDVRHFLCDGHDVRLSSAAMMAARFPYVSPSGRLPFCDEPPGSVHVVDGGYLDNSGGASIAELWDSVRVWVEGNNLASSGTCIVPYLLIVDSGYGPTPDPKGDNVRELLVPPKGFRTANSERTIEGRNAAALEFRRPVTGVVPTDRVATLYLHSQPGAEAPNGWTLDDTTIDALEAQLASNSDALAEIAQWFTGSGC